MGEEKLSDPELGQAPKGIPHWRMVINQGVLTPEIERWHYHGKGTEEDPFAVSWIDNDPRNPMLFSQAYKWSITVNMAFSVLAVSLCSSAFSGGMQFPLIPTLFTRANQVQASKVLSQNLDPAKRWPLLD
jgi:hypothetical protein